MSNEIERMFASLRADADSTPVMAATTLRSRANRRAATQAGLAGLALVAVIGGTAIGGQWLFAGQNRPLPPSAPSSSATAAATATPSVSPSMTPSSAPAAPPVGATTPSAPKTSASSPPTIPSSIPARAFLSAADLREAPRPTTDGILPELCDTRLRSDDRIGIRRSVHANYRDPDTPKDYVYDGWLVETITVYRGDGARRFIADIRDAVRDCPQETRDGTPRRYRLLSPTQLGDESALIESGAKLEESPDSSVKVWITSLVSIVRTGDTVTVLYVRGWENSSADQASVAGLSRLAHTRVTNWRD